MLGRACEKTFYCIATVARGLDMHSNVPADTCISGTISRRSLILMSFERESKIKAIYPSQNFDLTNSFSDKINKSIFHVKCLSNIYISRTRTLRELKLGTYINVGESI